MTDNRVKDVGSFLDDDSVPVEFRGKRICYSPSRQQFCVLDDNQRIQSMFGFVQFQRLNGAGVIDYNSRTRDYIMREYEKWENSITDIIEEEQDSIVGEQVNDDMSNAGIIGQEQVFTKDPSRMLRAYFITLFIIMFIITITLTVVVPLIMNSQSIV